MNRSFEQYRAIDLTIMGVILAVCEFLTANAAAKWFPNELYALSPTVAVVCIVMMRWGGYAAIHAVIGGLVYCLTLGGDWKQIVIYCVGNCFMLIALAWFKFFGKGGKGFRDGKEKVRSKYYFTLLFTINAFLGAQIGRFAVSVALGGSFSYDAFAAFLVNDIITLLFSVVVVLISRRVDGLFEDQKSYLIRTEEERKREENEKSFKNS
ncbi:MAG: hypothetical protein K2J77_04640 [Oscillospiraceae bacterium]|nr:hypothetical protein [Oscillospiraceae bacterium]